MRKLLTFFIALAGIVFAVGSPSQAQVGGLSFPGPPPRVASGGGGALTWTKTGTFADIGTGGLSSPQTFSQNIGTASSTRYVVCTFSSLKAVGSASGDLSAVTAAGIGLNRIAFTPTTNQRATEIWGGPVTTGSGAQNVVASFTSGFIDGIGVTCGTLTGSATTSSSSSVSTVPPGYPALNTNINTGSVTVVAGGISIFAGISDGASTTAWANGGTSGNQTDSPYTANGNGITATIANGNATASVVETVTGGGGVSGWVSASFQP
jgi:hypothetical protein